MPLSTQNSKKLRDLKNITLEDISMNIEMPCLGGGEKRIGLKRGEKN